MGDRMYSDDKGRHCVWIRKIGSLRRMNNVSVSNLNTAFLQNNSNNRASKNKTRNSSVLHNISNNNLSNSFGNLNTGFFHNNSNNRNKTRSNSNRVLNMTNNSNNRRTNKNNLPSILRRLEQEPAGGAGGPRSIYAKYNRKAQEYDSVNANLAGKIRKAGVTAARQFQPEWNVYSPNKN